MDATIQPLTDEQIDNYRKVLATIFGPYAFIMPKEQIEKFRDRLQKQIDSMGDTPEGL